jgi:hypothetical protein
MADLISETFNATTAPVGWTDTLTAGGTIDDTSTASTTMACTSATGSRSRRRSPVVAMSADGDTITTRISSAASFATMVVLRQDTGSTAFCPAILAVGSNWTAQRFRDATGYGAIAGSVTTRDIATHQWLRFRRISTTQIACEAAPDAAGSPGTWVLIGTTDATADALTLNMATTQLELITGATDTFAGSTVIEQVGDGSGAPAANPGVLLQYMREQARMAGIHFY